MKTNIKLKKANSYRLSQELLRNKALAKGVNLIAPETIFLSKDTSFGKNVTVEPSVVFGQKVKVGDNSYIKSFTHIEGTKIEKNVIVGPYARLRPGTILKKNTKIGNFVETKKTSININSKVNHLSYIGDTSIGKNSNIGAGTITCNYDGVKKSKTKIADNVFIGSNSSLVAPVKIDKDSIVGAGSVITKNVKKKSLAITRPPQIEIKNYKRKKKKLCVE
jgi:bifunctional UDP-N-acetylglucosamine pyrophosphorylase/glucosamine-1-phosphate N-acetyltransferase